MNHAIGVMNGQFSFSTENRRMRFYKIMLVVAGTCVGAGTQAADREFADIYTDCGLGAMISPNNDAVAAVTNVTWDLGTTAISSNLSSDETCSGGKEMSAAFIHDAYFDLEREIAAGQGEHLATLLTLLEVTAESQESFVNTIRQGLAESIAAGGDDVQDRYTKAAALYGVTQEALIAKG